MALLEVENLKKYFPVTKGAFLKKVVGHVKAVENVSFDIFKGDTLGIVGESGCGKSTTANLLLGLEAPTDGKNVNIEIRPTFLQKTTGQTAQASRSFCLAGAQPSR